MGWEALETGRGSNRMRGAIVRVSSVGLRLPFDVWLRVAEFLRPSTSLGFSLCRQPRAEDRYSTLAALAVSAVNGQCQRPRGDPSRLSTAGKHSLPYSVMGQRGSSIPGVWPDWEMKAPSSHGWVGVLGVLREPAGT